jgi:hypothetical protein
VHPLSLIHDNLNKHSGFNNLKSAMFVFDWHCPDCTLLKILTYTEGKPLVRDQPHFKIVTIIYIIRREFFFQENLVTPSSLQFRYEFLTKFMDKAHEKLPPSMDIPKVANNFNIRSELNLMTIFLQTDTETPSKLNFGD